MTNFIVK